jgi:hypothetical protein
MRSIGREVSGLRGAISLFMDGYTDGNPEERSVEEKPIETKIRNDEMGFPQRVVSQVGRGAEVAGRVRNPFFAFFFFTALPTSCNT